MLVIKDSEVTIDVVVANVLVDFSIDVGIGSRRPLISRVLSVMIWN